jgi:hypothetical protein
MTNQQVNILLIIGFLCRSQHESFHRISLINQLGTSPRRCPAQTTKNTTNKTLGWRAGRMGWLAHHLVVRKSWAHTVGTGNLADYVPLAANRSLSR